MKFNSSKSSFWHSRIRLNLIQKSSLIGLLISIKMIAAAPVVVGGVVITAAGVAAFFSGASLAIDIYDKVTGQYELTQQWWKYDRTIITKYRGVDIEQRWLAEQPSEGSNWKYRYTCKSEQFSENKYIELRNEFSIAHNGSSLVYRFA